MFKKVAISCLVCSFSISNPFFARNVVGLVLSTYCWVFFLSLYAGLSFQLLFKTAARAAGVNTFALHLLFCDFGYIVSLICIFVDLNSLRYWTSAFALACLFQLLFYISFRDSLPFAISIRWVTKGCMREKERESRRSRIAFLCADFSFSSSSSSPVVNEQVMWRLHQLRFWCVLIDWRKNSTCVWVFVCC